MNLQDLIKADTVQSLTDKCMLIIRESELLNMSQDEALMSDSQYKLLDKIETELLDTITELLAVRTQFINENK